MKNVRACSKYPTQNQIENHRNTLDYKLSNHILNSVAAKLTSFLNT